MGHELKQMRMQIRKLEAKVKSEKDMTVNIGQQAQVQVNPNKSRQEVNELARSFESQIARLEQEIHQLRIEQGKQSQDIEKIKLDDFINKRVLSFQETYDFIRRVLSMACDCNGKQIIAVSDDGSFKWEGKVNYIGRVHRKNRMSIKKTAVTLWKGNVRIKLEEDFSGVKSIAHWFDEVKLRPLYELHKKGAIRELFPDELDFTVQARDVQYPEGDRDELFNTDQGLR